MAIDPVCGMEIEEESAKHQSTFEGTVFYFCSADCRDEFDENPEEYVGEEPAGGSATVLKDD